MFKLLEGGWGVVLGPPSGAATVLGGVLGGVSVSAVETLRALGHAVVGGVSFGAFGAHGFVCAGGRGVAELVALGALKGGGFRVTRWVVKRLQNFFCIANSSAMFFYCVFIESEFRCEGVGAV
jgi:hypothetical protein